MTIKVKKSFKIQPSIDPDDLKTGDKLDLIKQEYALALKIVPDYENDKKEMASFYVELPASPEFKDLSKMNKLYAIAQSFLSRVSTLEARAIDNHSRWTRLMDLMESYIDDKKFKLLSLEKYEKMTNVKADAAVRNILSKEYGTLAKFKSFATQAESFEKIAQTKKKDLISVLQTLTKQVHVLSLEQQITRN